MDSLIGRDKIIMRTRKWYMRIFYHLLDVTVINSWLLYRRATNSSTSLAAKTMKLKEFRVQLAETLCKIRQVKIPTREGRCNLHGTSNRCEARHCDDRPNEMDFHPSDP